MEKKPMGIVRKIDELGRFVIPMEIRRAQGWGTKTPLELFATEEGLFVREYGRQDEVQEIVNKLNEADELTTNTSVKSAIREAVKFIEKG